MLPRSSSVPQSPAPQRVGVGIDTSRYGHYACFLRDDLQPAAAELTFAESAAGYQQLRQRLEQIAQGQGTVSFLIRLDAAGQYADNLLHFLQQRGVAGTRRADATPRVQASSADAPGAVTLSISCGDPQRNKNYRAALFGNQKSDPIEARACARYALSERPVAARPLSAAFRSLRQVAGRLQTVVRQRTRLLNQFHQLLALTFPELALVTKDLAAGWVLELVHRYPTAPLLANASATDLEHIPYLPHRHIDTLLSQARTSIASLDDEAVAELVRDQVRQLRDVRARQQRLEKLLVAAYHRLPEPNHLDTIPSIGDVTAAVLTAFMVEVERFATPGQLVKYFGILPIEVASGVDRDGNPRGPKRYLMSARGNDLVRRYLWMAALSAVRHNPAVRALYARVVKKHPDKKAIAIGHAMRKLLHLAFAVWKTRQPFDAEHYPWATPAHLDGAGSGNPVSGVGSPESGDEARSDIALSREEQVAGLKPDGPARTKVTATCSVPSTSADTPGGSTSPTVDFAHVKRQLPIARVLDQLGLTPRLRGKGPQKRCSCPIHRGDARGQTFSVHLEENVFHCFVRECNRKGDVIDLWASVNGMSLRDAALDLVRTFDLEPTPPRTEKRHG